MDAVPNIHDVGANYEPYMDETEHVRSKVAEHFTIYEMKNEKDGLLFYCQVSPDDLEERFDLLRKEMRAERYVPLLEQTGGEFIIRVVKTPPQKYKSTKVNLVFLLVTIATTSFAGASLWSFYMDIEIFTFSSFSRGILFFTFPLLAILGIHEMGHYIAAKRHGIAASLPFFIPMAPPLGTMGAFISIREPIPDKKALLDIGASGPIAGFIVAVPVALIGLWLTAHDGIPVAQNIGDTDGLISFNLPLFYFALLKIIPISDGVVMHPTAFAGWVGIFVTALNLLPIGQLDGGHIFRALFGKKSHIVGYGIMFLLAALSFFYFGWIIIVFLVLFLGVRHPPPLNDISPLGKKQWVAGAICAVLLIVCFVPIPAEQTEVMNEITVNDMDGDAISLLEFNSTNTSFDSITFVVENIGNTYLCVEINYSGDLTSILDGWNITIEHEGSSGHLSRDQSTIFCFNSTESDTLNMTITPPSTAQLGEHTGMKIKLVAFKEIEDGKPAPLDDIELSIRYTIRV